MLVDLMFAGICAIMWLPLVTGYCAYSYDRSFWLWFGLSFLLPGVSFFILSLLLWREQRDPGVRLLREAKRILARAETPEVEPSE